ncbi:Rpn family recombination-promoting nuclease/putative transposase [Methanobrevibacter curvatus]|uniref:PD-(D/E)XK nuclease family transposase n=1 Tax=Methanobrevibacter curvatus TaxID=49547 RepID=A0A166AN41_9EURY|nr:Rpn family recombination-promoting nuclease/putative transposase [Methanobrevibacter curvatus]KZX12251.1 PD-(D/E)XK nuclease family transposase [Methanobrevibacter curvatus]
MKLEKTNQNTWNYNPLNDFLFKKTFGEEGCEEQLKGLINANLKANKESLVKMIEILESKIIMPEIQGLKISILDLKVKDENKNIYIIEMQQFKTPDFKLNKLHYLTSEFSRSIKKGTLLIPENVNKHTLILITTFKISKSKKYKQKFNRKFNIMENTDNNTQGEVYTDKLKIINLDLKTYIQNIKTSDIQIEYNNELHQWLIYLNQEHFNKKIVKKVIKMNSQIKNVHDRAIEVIRTPEEYREYERIEQIKREYLGHIHYTKEEGMKLGKEEEKIENARKMKEDNIPYEKIRQYTGLSIEEIKNI